MIFILMMMCECLLCGRNDESDNHQKYDVLPYKNNELFDKENWGNVGCLIYRNTQNDKDDNYQYYDNYADKWVYEKWWAREFYKGKENVND